jgi:hypothetical protein
VDIGKRLERAVGVVANGEDRGAAAAATDGFGDRQGKATPASEDADRLAGEPSGFELVVE